MSRRNGALFHVAALVAVILPLAACDVAFQGMNASATDEWKKTYTLAPGGQLQLTNVNGGIDVTPSADASTVEVVAVRRVRASTEQAAKEQLKTLQITDRATPSEIAIEVTRAPEGMPFGHPSREVKFTVKVPKNTTVKVSTRNGSVHIAGLAGSVKVETTNGEITGENLAGPVDAGTTNGGINLQVAAVAPDGIRLDTTNGEIALRVPSDTKATLSAKWAHGSFEASGLKPEGGTERRRYEGKLNGGGSRIEMSTVNGQIRISS